MHTTGHRITHKVAVEHRTMLSATLYLSSKNYLGVLRLLIFELASSKFSL